MQIGYLLSFFQHRKSIEMRDIKKIITTCTRDCPNTCGLEATVENGRLIRLTGSKKHPLTRGLALSQAVKIHRPGLQQGTNYKAHDAWRVRLA